MIGEVLIRSGLEKDVDRALSAIGADSRIGNKYMRYGFGYGGPCLPRDNRAFAHYAERVGLSFPLGKIVDEFNRNHTEFMVQEAIWANADRLPFYMSSITYKPHTDIMEESQQYQFLVRLLEHGCQVYIEPSDLLPSDVVNYLTNTYDSVAFVKFTDLAAQGITVYKVNT